MSAPNEHNKDNQRKAMEDARAGERFNPLPSRQPRPFKSAITDGQRAAMEKAQAGRKVWNKDTRSFD
jgi:hypothetical protein